MQIENVPQYIKAEDIKSAKSVQFKILTESKMVDGKYGRKVETDILAIADDNKVKAKWSINNTNRKKLIARFGNESADWIGKEVNIQVQNINGKDAIMVI